MLKRLLVGLGLLLIPMTAWAATEIIGGGGAGGGLPTSGGTMTGELVVDALGLEFEQSDDLSDCSTFPSAGGGIFYDDSDGEFKKCQDNTLTALDTSGSHSGTITWSGTSILESGSAFQFGDASDATLTHTYANTGTDTTVAWSTALARFSHAVTIDGATTFTGETDIGTSPTIFSNTGITMQLDEDNDSTSSFIINDGADAAIWTFAEAGTLTWGGTSILETGAALTVGDGTDATITHTYNVSTGTDPVVAYTNDSVDFSTPVTADSFVADASALPSLTFNDSAFAGTEGQIVVNAPTDNDASMRLQVESGSAGTFITPILITTAGSGATTVQIGDCTDAEPPSCTNYISITEGGILTGEGSATIEADALAGDGILGDAQRIVCTGVQ